MSGKEHLDIHLNENLQDVKELEGCEFAEIKCSYVMMSLSLYLAFSAMRTSSVTVTNVPPVVSTVMISYV